MNSKRVWVLVKWLVLIGAVLAVYYPVLGGCFVWDDDTHVYGNLLARPGGLYQSWFTTQQPNYWPITWTVFWLQWKLWGMAPAGYHVVTVLLHLGCAALVWRVLRRLEIPGAWLAALVFAIHPVNVETGAWITQQKNLLCMVFALLCVERYLQFLGRRAKAAYAAALLAFTLAVLSKSAAVTVPAVLVGCAWWRDRTLRWRQVVSVLPFLGLAVLCSLNELWFQYHRAGAVNVRGDDVLHRLVTAGDVAVFYLGKILWPVRLCFVYPNPDVRVGEPLDYAPLLLLAVIMVGALWRHRGWGRPVLFGLGYFLVMIFPVLGFLNIYFMRYAWVSDHWQYMAMPGPVALVVGSATWAAGRAGPRVRVGASIVAAGMCMMLGVLAHRRAEVFRGPESLWRDTIARNPGAWLARNNWATLLIQQGRLEEAREQLEAVLALQPDSFEAHLNLAVLHMDRREWPQAAEGIEAARRLDENNVRVWFEAGRLALLQDQLDLAASRFARALERSPRHAGALAALGIVHYRQGRIEEAARELAQAVVLDSRQAEAWYALGEIRYADDDLAAAAEAYEAAVRAKPALPNGYNSLGVALIRMGRRADAVAAFREAVRLEPANAGARANLERARGSSQAR